MHDLDLLVPAALVEPALANELARDLAMPHLARLVGRATATALDAMPPHALLMPWQTWLFDARDADSAHPAGEVNVAELWAMACGLAPRPRGGRWLVEPAHFTIARDHLRLDDPQALAWTLDEARALAGAVAPVLADAGWTLEPIEPVTLRRWFVHRDDAVVLTAPAIDRAIGDNVAHWQPHGSSDTGDAADDVALDWRRCVNEIQMLWFAHPVNDAREARGDAPVNTLWLSGNGAARAPLPRYRAVDSSLPLAAALPVEPDAPRALETFDVLIDPARGADWGTWRDRLIALDTRIGAALDAQGRGEVGLVRLVLCGTRTSRSFTLERGGIARGLRDLWQRLRPAASLADLFAEPA